MLHVISLQVYWFTKLLTSLPLIAIFSLFLTAPAHADTLTVNSISIVYDQQKNYVMSFDISGVDNYFFNDTYNLVEIANGPYNYVETEYLNLNNCNQPQSGEVVCTNLPVNSSSDATLQPGTVSFVLVDMYTGSGTSEYGTYDFPGFPTPTPTPPVTPGLTLTPGVPITPTTVATLSPSPYPDGTYPDPVTVALSANATYDNTVANTYYTVDGGSQQTYSSPFTVTGSGSHTITYWSVDSAGNQESPNTQTFSISEAYSLSGTVFTDSNRDGVQDNGEQGYPNATVTVSQNNQTIASTTTDNNGDYSFPSIESGIYSVAVTLPSGDVATTTNPATVDLTANTTQNFGIAPYTSPSVGSITVTPSPATVNSSVTANASFTDNVGGATASWNWGDGNTTTGTVTENNGSGSVTNTHTYTALGSDTIVLTVTNSAGSSTAQTVVAVVPSGGLPNGNLSGKNYNEANFSNQNLMKVNGSNAEFENVNFSSANLFKANFSNSDLEGSNFTDANLKMANLSNSNLSNDNFTGANLTQANLSNTTLTGVTWSNTTCPDGTNSNNDGNTCVGHL